MTFDLEAVRARFSASDVLVPLAERVLGLVSLWPLDEAIRINNDVLYGEELQVRITREIAERISGAQVTTADAEYVYEGGVDEIPGRPQAVVQALLAANDAYDEASGFSDDRDASRITGIGQTLGVSWGAEEVEQLQKLVDAAAAAAGQSQAKSETDDESVQGVLSRVALTASAYCGVLALGEKFGSTALIFANELNEIQGLPRIFTDVQGTQVFSALAKNIIQEGQEGMTAEAAFIEKYSDVAQAECAKHREDVLWDPAEAKKKAKEADEAKNKAALAAKFAHVNNDEGKQHVEL